jgi:hypothetical protein
MRDSDATGLRLAIAVPMAILATGAAAWLLHAEITALSAADDADAPPVITDEYRPGPGWMHRDTAGFAAPMPAPVAQWHALTNAGVSPTLKRWIPLP